MNDKNSIATQIRLSSDIYNFIRQEAERLGISQNAFTMILLDRGRKLWESDITHLLKE